MLRTTTFRRSDALTTAAAASGICAIAWTDPATAWNLPLSLLAATVIVVPVARWLGARAASLHLFTGAAAAALAVQAWEQPWLSALVLLGAQAGATGLLHTLESEEHLRTESFVDGLTRIGNRRRFDDRLEHWSRRRSGEPAGVLVADLDHFKAVNDRFGHHAGDQVLIQTAERLRAAIDPEHLVVRFGGEEFALLLPHATRDDALAVAEACRRAVGEEPYELDGGVLLTMTLSVGYAVAPDDEADVGALVARADHALYAAKHRGRDRSIGAHEATAPSPVRADGSTTSLNTAIGFLERLSERVDQIDRDIAVRTSARYAERIAQRMGLSAERARTCGLAARFNDIGKLAIPERILVKEGPLTDDEWALIRAHPELGSLIVELAPELRGVSEIIRHHRECWDGTGYPNGTDGERIPLESRIVGVCDAWQAMRSERPWRSALDLDAAVEEITREAGSRFDPAVVEELIAVVREDEDARRSDLAA